MSAEVLELENFYTGLPFRVTGPTFWLDADGRHLTPDAMSRVAADMWRDGDVEVRLVAFRTADGSRELVLEADGLRHVDEVCLLDGGIDPSPFGVHNHVWFDVSGLAQSTVLFVRGAGVGLFACYANPFGRLEIDDDRVRLSYRPAMDVDGRFRSDPLVLGGTELADRPVRLEMLPGRDVAAGNVARYADMLGPEIPTTLDAGEVRAVRAAVAARVPWQPPRARTAHWDWGENLYRLDIATSETREIYDRLIRLCEELGIETLLLAPGHAGTPQAGMEADMAGGGPWQTIMWLGKGVDVGAGRWEPEAEVATEADTTPVIELLASMRTRDVEPVAYVNPQYLWCREDAWQVVRDHASDDHDAYRLTCLAVPEARRWLVGTARGFASAYDLGGFSFDFVYWLPCHAVDHGHEPGTDSRYAQWDGYRRLVAELREALPEAWLETLIGGLELLPWGAADVTHPHPSMGDNQPQWVPAWPDLSLDRVNGNWQRRAAYWMRNFGLLPSYKVPGQVGHQANRMRFFTPERGWDWEGARYNLLSAIASGPSSLSVCFLPCWDEDEWEGFRERDGAFFRRWIDFAREHARVLARLEDVFDEPRPGAVDGTIALDDDGAGFVFLVNPDYTEHTAKLPVTDGFALRELHPQAGRLWDAEVSVEPHGVGVYEVVAESDLTLPAVLGISGAVEVDESAIGAGDVPAAVPAITPNVGAAGQLAAHIELTEAEGIPGSTCVAAVRLPSGELRELTVRFADDGVSPTLGPWRDVDGGEVDLSELEGSARIATSWAPGEALPGLLARLAPPLAPVGDETRNPWSDPSRLRLFPALLDPKAARVRMWVDGDEVGVDEAYIGTYVDVSSAQTGDNNLLGYYVDLTGQLQDADDLSRPWDIVMELELLWAGQLTGVHVAHLPRRTTTQFEVVRADSDPISPER
ncbi:MAG: hypothetical protein KY437_00520 [Actinobacteria bacterium]|nr:hypothetical protein [Actinomycetota bacterium]